MPTVKVQDIVDKIDEVAPSWLAEDGDPIGLMCGRRDQTVSSVAVTLDVTPAAVEEASRLGVQMIVSHHALIYKPISSLEPCDARMKMIARLVADDIAVYTAHTNYDLSPGGTNDALAEALEIIETRILAPCKAERLLKIVVFVPPEALEAVRNALCSAGAGHIGNYSDCTFRAAGKGTFRPLEGTDPYIGKTGELEEVDECRLETIVPEHLLSRTVDAMLEAHPYEEVAYDIYRLENPPISYGFGRVGRLERPMSLDSFTELVRERLDVEGLRMVGERSREIRRVALCAGGGDFLVREAAAAGADVYVTGTAGYHHLLEASNLGLAMIDAGHFETERPGMIALADRLKKEFAGEAVQIHYVEGR